MDLQSVLIKIRKLRALASSANEHEAAAAAAAAKKLVEQYRIDEAQIVEDTEIVKDREPLEWFFSPHSMDPTEPEGQDAEVVFWKMALIVGLTDTHGCLSYTWTHKDSGDKGVRLVGKPSDIALVRAMYEWLRDEIERLSVKEYEADFYRGRHWMDSYRLGAVRGCLLAMRTAADEIRMAASSEEARSAIVLLDGRVGEVEKALEQMHGEEPPSHAADAPELDWDAFVKGEVDGREVGQIKKLGGG